ncbi:MAG: hypothetical protein EOO19_00040 [Chryseobacterium sp.]|nr:MAG: hypothetical protein EOO19_00040 [Chryseobacterium sp.]
MSGQNSQLDKIEKEIRKNAMEGKFDKQLIDLNNDGNDDVIYSSTCAGDPKCISVYLKVGEIYKEQVNEQCSQYNIWTADDKKLLYLNLYHCCGESPYISNRLFEFNKTNASLKENYVLTNNEYTEDTSLLTPYTYAVNPYYAKVTFDNYNLRFSPSIDKLSKRVRETFTYACEDNTNIIAKIKVNSRIKVLAELIEKERIWLFIEIESNSIAGKCNPVNFEFKNQKLRGWVSSKYAERE